VGRAVARKIVLQVASRDIGQLTDFDRSPAMTAPAIGQPDVRSLALTEPIQHVRYRWIVWQIKSVR
jgi:hypothetical protein